MNKDDLMKELKKRVKEENIIKHMIAVSVVMKALAIKLGEDGEKWEIAGLLHDIDYDLTKNNPNQHSILGAKIVLGLGIDEEIAQAIKTHNGIHGFKRNTLIEKALYASDPVTGLITACAMTKGKKIQNIDLDFVLKRFHEKRFAAGANREQIKSSEELGIDLEEFLKISLEAMKENKKGLGL